MKVLILGAKGNLGHQLKKIFVHDKDFKLLTWDREEVDLLDLKTLEVIINEVKPEVIINAAAYNNVDKCEIEAKSWDLAQTLNVQLPKLLAEICHKSEAILIHYSSDYVFGQEISRDTPYSESDQPAPINKYGLSKQQGEDEVLKLKANGLKIYLIRTSKLFGPKGKNPLAKPSFFDIMIELSEKEEEIKVVDQEVSSFTYTPDLAEATKNLLEEKYPFGIYHLTNRGQATWHQGAQELFKILKKSINLIPISGEEFRRPATRPGYSVLINTKAKPLPYWKQALAQYLQTKKL